MNLSPCENPRWIVNPLTKERILVPCGQCKTCHNRKSSEWVNRLDVEMQCWKYCVFFTLTYDENHIPEFVLTNSHTLYDFENDYCVDFSDSGIDGRSLAYLKRRVTINHLFKPDVVKFVKRLRYYNDSLNHSYEKRILRYYIVGEYGPTTLRAHYHGLFFFSSDVTAQNFQKIISKAWTLGRIDWSFVRNNASAYVAKYVNCLAHLPKIYLHKELRPFSLSSKQPPLGSLHYMEEEIFQIFDRGLTEHREFSRQKQEYVYVPLLRSVKDSIFPKVQGFNNLSHLDRVALYSIARFSEAKDFLEFKDYCYSITDDLSPSPWLGQLTKLVNSPTDYPLYNLWCVSSRVLHQAAVFDCTVDYYVSRIEQYYRKIELLKLRKQYEFQSEYCNKYGPQGLINYYTGLIPSMQRNLIGGNLNGDTEILRYYRGVMASFGIDLNSYLLDPNYRKQYFLFNLPEFKQMCASSAEIYRRSTKTKVKNSYLLTHPESRIFKF